MQLRKNNRDNGSKRQIENYKHNFENAENYNRRIHLTCRGNGNPRLCKNANGRSNNGEGTKHREQQKWKREQ